MFKGSVYCRRWTYQGKKRKAWGIRYSVNGTIKREIVSDTKEGAQAELDRVRDDYQQRRLGHAEGKTLTDLAPLYLEYQRAKERDMPTVEARLEHLLTFFDKTPLEEIEERADQYKLARRGTYRKRPCRIHPDGERCPKCDQRIAKGTVNRELAALNHMLSLTKRKFKLLRHQPCIERLE